MPGKMQPQCGPADSVKTMWASGAATGAATTHKRQRRSGSGGGSSGTRRLLHIDQPETTVAINPLNRSDASACDKHDAAITAPQRCPDLLMGGVIDSRQGLCSCRYTPAHNALLLLGLGLPALPRHVAPLSIAEGDPMPKITRRAACVHMRNTPALQSACTALMRSSRTSGGTVTVINGH